MLFVTRKLDTELCESYWGQDGAGSQQRLSFYCEDDTIDVIPLAFLYIFRGTGGDPVIDFANVSNPFHSFEFMIAKGAYSYRLAINGTILSSPAPPWQTVSRPWRQTLKRASLRASSLH